MEYQYGVTTCMSCGGPTGSWYADGYWLVEPGDIIYKDIVYIYYKRLEGPPYPNYALCLSCKVGYELKWLRKASTSDLLLAINYSEFSIPAKNLYKKLLAGEAL